VLLFLLVSRQLVQTIESGRFVAFGQGRIVEHGIYEIVDFAFQDEDRLANMQKLGSALTNNMDAKHVERITVKD
jgi:hypothetical protein